MAVTETVYLESLGCAKNLVDSEVMLGILAQAGYRFTRQCSEADIIIINTCAFIEDAVEESIDTIFRHARQKTAGACRHLVVCGCLPQRYKDSLPEALPGVDLFLGTGETGSIARHLKKLSAGKGPGRVLWGRKSFLMHAATPRILATPGGSAYIKIAEGCAHRCTYCTIPAIRGPCRGRPQGSIIREAATLAGQGIREINLISQDTTQYRDLAGLLRRLARISGLSWIRLLYCHPRNLTGDIIKVIAGEEKVCSYIDMPLQHISDRVLKRMGRRTTRKKTEALLDALRRQVPGIAIRTTFIVGFPGETAGDFKELLSFAEQFRFDHLGVFPYRDEEGTPAAQLGPKVREKIKQERYALLMQAQAAIAREKNRAYGGRELDVLIEGASAHPRYALQGRAAFQAPEVDGVVYTNDAVPAGSFVKMRITRALTYDLVGKRVLSDEY